MLLTKTVLQDFGRYVNRGVIQHALYVHSTQNKFLISNLIYLNHAEHKRTLHTTNVQNINLRAKARSVAAQFVCISRGSKLFWFKRTFDRNFNIDEFNAGAKLAVFHVSTKMSEGKIDELKNVLTTQGMQACCNAYELSKANPDELKLDPESMCVLLLGIKRRKKVAYASVIYVSLPETVTLKTQDLQNLYTSTEEGEQLLDDAHKNWKDVKVILDIIDVTKCFNIKYVFRRDYSLGADAHWLIDDMTYAKTQQKALLPPWTDR